MAYNYPQGSYGKVMAKSGFDVADEMMDHMMRKLKGTPSFMTATSTPPFALATVSTRFYSGPPLVGPTRAKAIVGDGLWSVKGKSFQLMSPEDPDIQIEESRAAVVQELQGDMQQYMNLLMRPVELTAFRDPSAVHDENTTLSYKVMGSEEISQKILDFILSTPGQRQRLIERMQKEVCGLDDKGYLVDRSGKRVTGLARTQEIMDSIELLESHLSKLSTALADQVLDNIEPVEPITRK